MLGRAAVCGSGWQKCLCVCGDCGLWGRGSQPLGQCGRCALPAASAPGCALPARPCSLEMFHLLPSYCNVIIGPWLQGLEATVHLLPTSLHVSACRDWKQAFEAVIPPRKRKAGEGEEDEEEGEGDEQPPQQKQQKQEEGQAAGGSGAAGGVQQHQTE